MGTSAARMADGVGTATRSVSERELVEASVRAFGLDLRGLTVFTEAATGAFRCTPVIALAAGAAQVFAIARTSRHGTAGDAADAVRQLAGSVGVEQRLVIVEDLTTIERADIVTNTGFVRPLGAQLVGYLKPSAVLPLMWETWEHRAHELDLGACVRSGILVLGTNEGDPRLRTMDHVGTLALRLLADAGRRVEGARVVVVGGGRFASSVARSLAAHGAQVALLSATDVDADVTPLRAGADLASSVAESLLASADALVVADHVSQRLLIGSTGDITAERLASVRPALTIAHLSGLVDAAAIRAAGGRLVPHHTPARASTMSVTAALLGPRPVIELHTAGLKVGQIMHAATQRSRSLSEARRSALQDSLCQDFSRAQYEAAGVA